MNVESRRNRLQFSRYYLRPMALMLLLLLAVTLSFYFGRRHSGSLISIFLGVSNQVSSNYDAAIRSGIQGNSYPAQFNQLFPGTQNIISYYTGSAGAPAWTSSAGLYGRYVFKMHLSIALDKGRTNIISYGPPTFYVYEITNIVPGEYDNPRVSMVQQATFFSYDWLRLLQATGDFAILGITLKTNEPVKGFEENWNRF